MTRRLKLLLSGFRGDSIIALLARGASGSLMVGILATGVAFAVQILLARLLGVSQFGTYIYVLTWINTVLLVTKLGLDGSLVQYVSAYNVKQQWGLLRGMLRWSMSSALVASVVAGIVMAIVIWSLRERLDPDMIATFWVGLLLLPLLTITILRQATLRGFKKVVQASLPDAVFRSLVIALLAGGYYFFQQAPLLAWHAMIFNLLGALTAFVIGTVWLMRVLPRSVKQTRAEFLNREWLRVSLPRLLISGSNLILHKADVLMIGVLLSVEQAGIYAIATRVADLAMFGKSAVNSISAPMISEYYITKNQRDLQKTVTLSAMGITAFSAVIIVFCVILGKPILNLFGEEFVSGYLPLMILLAGNGIISMGGSVGFVMTMTGHHNQAAKIVAVCALINIILNAIMIPLFGLVGAALATVASTSMMIISMTIYVWRKLSINASVLPATP